MYVMAQRRRSMALPDCDAVRIIVRQITALAEKQVHAFQMRQQGEEYGNIDHQNQHGQAAI